MFFMKSLAGDHSWQQGRVAVMGGVRQTANQHRKVVVDRRRNIIMLINSNSPAEEEKQLSRGVV